MIDDIGMLIVVLLSVLIFCALIGAVMATMELHSRIKRFLARKKFSQSSICPECSERARRDTGELDGKLDAWLEKYHGDDSYYW